MVANSTLGKACVEKPVLRRIVRLIGKECCDQLVMSAMSTEREARPVYLPVLTLKNRKNLRQETVLTVTSLVHKLGQVIDLLPDSFYRC